MQAGQMPVPANVARLCSMHAAHMDNTGRGVQHMQRVVQTATPGVRARLSCVWVEHTVRGVRGHRGVRHV